MSESSGVTIIYQHYMFFLMFFNFLMYRQINVVMEPNKCLYLIVDLLFNFLTQNIAN